MPNDVLSGTETGTKAPKTPDDVLDILNDDTGQEDDIDETPKTPKKAKTEEDDEDDELKTPRKGKEKDDDEDEDDDELELVDPDEEVETIDLEKEDDIEIAAPPRKKEILAKYPNIFKDFPFMEKVMYRDRQYTELFGSFDDAKELAGKAEVFNNFEQQLLAGNTEEILKDVKETDPKAFDRIVDNYLRTLHKVDKDAYFEVASNVIKQAIQEMNNDKNDSVKEAAIILNQWMGWGDKFTAPKARVDDKDTAEKSEAEKARLEIVQERFIGARDTLQSQTDNTLKATISEYIDPRNVMTSYIKKNAINDTLSLLANNMGKDPSFVKNLNNLWRSAFDAKFSQDSLNKIKRFYLGRAKSLLPKALAKARAEALKNDRPSSEREEEDEKEEQTPRRSRGPIPAGRPSQPKKNEMKKGESVAEFLARD